MVWTLHRWMNRRIFPRGVKDTCFTSSDPVVIAELFSAAKRYSHLVAMHGLFALMMTPKNIIDAGQPVVLPP